MNEGEQGICITESRVQDKALLHFLGRGEQGKASGARGRPRREHQEAPAPGGNDTRRRRRQVDDEHQEAAAPEGVAVEGEESRGAATGGG
jgi:hypothetical protein